MAAVLLVLVLFCHCALGDQSSDWTNNALPIRLLSASSTRGYFPRGEEVLHEDNDYSHVTLTGSKVSDMNSELEGISRAYMDWYITSAGKELVSRATGSGINHASLDGKLPHENEPKYSYYNVHKSCEDRVPVEVQDEEYMGDESNRVSLWIVNEMSNEFSVSLDMSHEESTSTTTTSSTEGTATASASFSASGFGVTGTVSASGSHQQSDSIGNTTSESTTKAATYSIKVKPSEAIKLTRFMTITKTTTHYERRCHIKGYLSFELKNSYKGSRRWFMPVTELAKVYSYFVVDDLKENSVVFTFPEVEVASGSSHVKKTLGFETKNLDKEFLSL